MKESTKDFVHRENINRYQKRLQEEPLGTESDEAERKTVMRLLEEEKLSSTPPPKDRPVCAEN